MFAMLAPLDEPLMRGSCRNLCSRLLSGAALLATSVLGAPVGAQQPAPAAAATQAPQFGPGVVTTIEPEVDAADTVSIHDIVELRADQKLEWTPSKWLEWDSATPAPTNRTLYEISKDAAFLQDVWCLEFSFKPLRMIEVDIPQQSGRAVRKQIWYMVYRVRNTGAGLQGEAAPDGSYTTTPKSTDNLKLIPQFILTSHERVDTPGAVRKAYLDRVIPAAMAAIQRREMPSGTLLNSVQISEQVLPIEAGRAEHGVWGVAMWEDVDPELDFFSMYVSGLTNAYRWRDPDGAFQPGDRVGKGRTFARKMLQLNFWRPGDALDPSEREIRYGVAPGESELYSSGEGVAYQWVYR
jgi:hypothetical protein